MLLCAAGSLCAQEKKFAAGLGAEWNMNSREYFAGGAALSLDYNLPRFFALGLGLCASANFSDTVVLEPSALLRWYFPRKGYTGLFAQIDAGAFIIFEDEEITPLFLGGLRAGYRLPLGQSLYVEPYGRLGYPFVFGVGVVAGIRLVENKADAPWTFRR